MAYISAHISYLQCLPWFSILTSGRSCPGCTKYVKWVFDHLPPVTYLRKRPPSLTSGTPHRGFFIRLTVEESKIPLIFRPKNSWNLRMAIEKSWLPLREDDMYPYWVRKFWHIKRKKRKKNTSLMLSWYEFYSTFLF